MELLETDGVAALSEREDTGPFASDPSDAVHYNRVVHADLNVTPAARRPAASAGTMNTGLNKLGY